MKKLNLLLLAACTMAMQADTKELVITSKIIIDRDAEDDLLKEMKEDSKALTRKYANARGVASVETTVDASEENRCDACEGRPPRDDETKSNDGESQKCDECASGAAQEEEVAECSECQDHVQAEAKVETDEEGQQVCSDCKDTLRSCKKCCKKKCCKKCKKCCKKCCTSSSTTCCS